MYGPVPNAQPIERQEDADLLGEVLQEDIIFGVWLFGRVCLHVLICENVTEKDAKAKRQINHRP